MAATRQPNPALGLLLSCHPMPCVAVTAFATAYAAAIGGSAGQLVAIAAAVLAGQLCVGWCNDAIDGGLDEVAARDDKPIATGMIARRTVAIASVIAGAACIVLSFRLGMAAALLHLAAVLSALSYNAVLKSTVLSPVPYLFAFGLLPVVTTLAVDSQARPPALRVLAAVLFGGAAHFGNTVGDAEADAITGVRGLPQRLGAQRSLTFMAVLIAAAALLLLMLVLQAADEGAVRRGLAIGLLLSGTLVAAAGASLRVGLRGGQAAWRLTLLAVGLAVAGFLISA